MQKQKNLQEYSVELAKDKIRFYKPFERLILRKIVQDVLSSSSTARIDLFAIFDGVAKRGGFAKVEQSKRWLEIDYSLPYYKLNFKELYKEHITKKQAEIYRQLKLHEKSYTVIEESFVELHFVSTSSAGGYYHFEEDENSFCKQNFTHVDLYLNIKSICCTPSPTSNIICEYADKYLLARKWLIMKGFSKPWGEEELDQLQIMKIYNNNAAIGIIGWNITNILLALKLNDLKFNVVLYTNLQKQHDKQYLERLMSVQQGVFYLDDGVGGPFSYRQLLVDNQVQLCEVSNYCGLIDQNGRTIPEFRVRESEELFLGLLADFKFEDSNKKLLFNQVKNLLQKKSTLSSILQLNDELNLMKWHMQRYLMLNNLQGEQTTVNTHSNYLSRRKHKIYMAKKKPIYIKNTIKLVQKVFKNINIVQGKPKSIDFCNNSWLIEERLNQKRSVSSLVYGDSQQIYEMVSKRNFRIPNMEHQNFSVMKDLSSNTWINCCFRFRHKLQLKSDIFSQLIRRKKDFSKTCHYDLSDQNCSFQFNGKLGFYYYFIVEEGKTLLARCKIEKILSNSSTSVQLKKSLSTEILKQFEANLLSSKLPELSEPQIIQYSHFFFLKEDTITRDRIVKLKNWQRMYLCVGLPWALNANKLSSQIDICNQIQALICNVYYQLYKFDQKAKQKFSKEYKQKKIEISKREKQLPNFLTQISSNLKVQTLISNPAKIPQSSLMKNTKLQSQSQKLVPQPIINPSLFLQTPEPHIFMNIQVVFNLHPTQTQIFINQAFSSAQKLQKDAFGFENEFIKSTLKFLNHMIFKFKTQLQQLLNKKNILKQNYELVQSLKETQKKISIFFTEFQQTLKLQKPFKLSKNMFLHSLGQIKVKLPSIKSIIKKVKQIQHEISINRQSGQVQSSQKTILYEIDVKIFDSYMTKRQYYSLENPLTTSVYVQCVLFVQKPNSVLQIPLFVIFDETNLAIFYYHTSLTKLVSAFNESIEKQRKIFSQKQQFFYRSNCLHSLQKDSKKIHLIFSELRIKIEEQLKFQDKGGYMSEVDVFDKILTDKLKAQVPQQVYQNPAESSLFTRISYPESNEEKSQFLISMLNSLTKTHLQKYRLKSNISFMDIFFGYFSSKFFVFQIYWARQLQIFSKGQQTSDIEFQQILSDIKSQDPLLFKEIEDVMDENSLNLSEDFPFILQFDETGLQVERKFLAGKNDPLNIKAQSIEDTLVIQKETSGNKLNQKRQESYFVQKSQLLKNYIFIKEFSFKESYERKNDRNKVKCFMMIGENDKRMELDLRQDPMQLIISILLDTWDYDQIYNQFKNLLQHQISNCEYNLPPRMKLYYESTRKKSSVFNFGQVDQLRNTLSYKKKIPVGKDKNKIYKTQYCQDQDDRQTIYEHIQNETMIFADGEIIICKY